MSNMGVNRVILIGNAGQDAEVKATSRGKNVANFSLAIHERFRDRAGKSSQRVEWVRCVAWNKLAEIAGKYVNKGGLVFVEGRLQTRQYETHEGAEKTVTEVVVTTLRVLIGGKNENPAQSDGDAPAEAAPGAEDGDIPF